MLYELVDRIEIHNAEKIDGVHRQMLTIHYNCIGFIAIPDKEKLEKPSIMMQTRKGVAVSYAPKEKAKKKPSVLYSTSNAIRTLVMVRKAKISKD